ncbi:hypothetical protein [Hyphomicrobium sp.]|uniref:hypothetical protein n=1 Tax=Hyphomicrobium sp. TaxID=82 RepID=UPI001DE8FD30|nr:hypothetical protein [Hyphomicrobium sp.]MBY0560065.1 hypothetical protein [Hyphomicrobium sp.]
MLVRVLIAALLVPTLTAWGEAPTWPVSGPMPDRPVSVREQSYAPVNAGAKSYRPVEPMPWGDINRRVAPKQPDAKPNSQGHDAH